MWTSIGVSLLCFAIESGEHSSVCVSGSAFFCDSFLFSFDFLWGEKLKNIFDFLFFLLFTYRLIHYVGSHAGTFIVHFDMSTSVLFFFVIVLHHCFNCALTTVIFTTIVVHYNSWDKMDGNCCCVVGGTLYCLNNFWNNLISWPRYLVNILVTFACVAFWGLYVW